ncbi:MAG TPA: 3-hydroxybutyryl-CoA dehydrogenase [Planctomycetota bacterium]|nr:3-hydroxybutyryl-CoA dehydrogenase [Planctomycetota bacterium]
MAIQKVGVVGCGLMGHGIAQVAAQGGFDVLVVETEQKFLDAGLARIDKSLAKLAEKAVEKGKPADQAKAESAAVRARIRGTLDRKALADRDLVVEAIVENLDVKRELFADLGSICKKEAILASNTSSFPIAECASASGRPAQVVGLHFFNPVQLMRLVEVVRTPATSDESFAAARAFGEACGKTPVACKDTPGFVVNRLLVPYMVQALLMLERGDATAADIDAAMKLGCGHPMGPIELTDYVGLDTTLAILEGWVKAHPKEGAFAIPAVLKKKVSDGKLGRKSGEGFYKWQGDKRL